MTTNDTTPAAASEGTRIEVAGGFAYACHPRHIPTDKVVQVATYAPDGRVIVHLTVNDGRRFYLVGGQWYQVPHHTEGEAVIAAHDDIVRRRQPTK